MARLFGIITPSPVDITISFPPYSQLGKSTHGWGLGCYNASGRPYIQKAKRTTLSQNQPITISAQTYLLISHMRRASSGRVSDINAHPFRFKQWIFAHNGTIHKEKLFSLLKKPFNQSFESEPIDSEVYFHFILQSMKEKGERAGLKEALSVASDRRGANFVLSDGVKLYAYCYGLPLFWLKWKYQQPFHVKSAETDTVYQSNQLSSSQAFIVSSERLSSGAWMRFDNGELLIVNKNLTYETVRI